jgi:SAM-dependent methyltransferase
VKANLYKDVAHLYDLISRQETEDIGFYLDKIPETASVLEVGCGTGRIAIPTAQRGNKITGIDLSEKMLLEFKKKITAELEPQITLLNSDMTDFELDVKFDWVIFPSRSFQALTSSADREKCLALVKEHMHADSRLILNFFNPNDDILEHWGKQDMLDFEHTEHGKTIKRYLSQDWFCSERQILATSMTYEIFEDEKLIETIHDTHELGYLYHSQCLDLFSQTGFDVVESYADYQGSPLKEEERKELIYTLKINKF